MNYSAIFFLLLLLVAACAADSDLGVAPGACKLDCNNTKIGANDMRIRFLSPTQVALNCYGKADTAYPQAMSFRFVVEKRKPVLPAEKGSDESTASTGTTTTPPLAAELWQPVSGISFHPILLQGQGAVENDADNPGQNRFQGVVTDSGSWCTDSCGVGTIEVKPICRSALNDMKYGIFSGSLSETVGITVNP